MPVTVYIIVRYLVYWRQHFF